MASFKQTIVGLLALIVAAMAAYLTGTTLFNALPQNWWHSVWLGPATGSWYIFLAMVVGLFVIALLSLIVLMAKGIGEIIIESLPKRSKRTE